jgi:hypothetical protein
MSESRVAKPNSLSRRYMLGLCLLELLELRLEVISSLESLAIFDDIIYGSLVRLGVMPTECTQQILVLTDHSIADQLHAVR